MKIWVGLVAGALAAAVMTPLSVTTTANASPESPPVSATARAKATSLKIVTSGLPLTRSARAKITITNPKGKKQSIRVTGTATVRLSVPGKYKWTASVVQTRDAEYTPSRSAGTFKIKKGKTKTIRISYSRVPQAPAAPGSVIVTPADGGLQVTWAAPDDGGKPITGYVAAAYLTDPVTVDAGEPAGTCSTTQTSCTISPLTNGTKYYVAVTAQNEIGESSPSRTASGTPARVPDTPAAPTVTLQGLQGISVTWTAPASDGGSPITRYEVTAQTNGTANQLDYPGVQAATPPQVIPMVRPPVLPTGPTPPSEPLNVTVIGGNATATVNWTAPASDGGMPITNYMATASPGGESCFVAAPATSCTVGKLSNGTVYTFTVRALNGGGWGPWSTPSNTIGQGAPAQPESRTCSLDVGVIPPVRLACEFTGLTPRTSYTFTVVAFNASGPSAASPPSTPLTVPGIPDAPTNVTAAASSRQATISWIRPANDGGAPITEYTATASPGGSMCTTTATSCTITGLTNDVTYTVTVTAKNSIGTSQSSAPSAPFTPVRPPFVYQSIGVPVLAPSSMTVTMNSITSLQKTGSVQVTINYTLANNTTDKQLDEGTFKIFYSDGSSEPQYGFFGSLFPGDTRTRSYTWEYLNGKTPLFVEYDADFFGGPQDNTLKWLVPAP